MDEFEGTPQPERRWAIIVHGGAHEVSPDKEAACRAGVQAAADAGRQILQTGGSSIQAAYAALRVLEDDPTFNAGYGSALNTAGQVEMDAALMDGRTLDIGGVAGIVGVKHPIQVAHSLLHEKEILLTGQGARQYASTCSAELCEPQDLISPEQQRTFEDHNARTHPGHDTVGCVALDMQGNLAAGTSTGGLVGQRVGRIGDSPLAGCGFYADNSVGAVALSGEGEALARMMVAARFIHHVSQQKPDEILKQVLEQMRLRVGGDGGGIAITPSGAVGWWHNSPDMPVAYADWTGERIHVYINKDEEIQNHG